MKWALICSPLIFSPLLNLCPDPTPGAKGDLKKLQGVWLVSAFEVAGRGTPLPLQKVVFETNNVTLKVGAFLEEGRVTIAATKSPHWIDLTMSTGADKGKTLRGIFRFLDGELFIAIGTEVQRPTDFSYAGKWDWVVALKQKND